MNLSLNASRLDDGGFFRDFPSAVAVALQVRAANVTVQHAEVCRGGAGDPACADAVGGSRSPARDQQHHDGTRDAGRAAGARPESGA
eukprot:gene13391-38421_t